MERFNRRGPGRFGKRSSGGFNRRDSGRTSRGFGRPIGDSRKEMHEVTCDKCGKTCEVPFKPTGEKPVYCRDCYRKDDSPGQESRFGSSSRGSRPRFENSRRESGHESSGNESSNFAAELEQINAKLDKILELLNGE